MFLKICAPATQKRAIHILGTVHYGTGSIIAGEAAVQLYLVRKVAPVMFVVVASAFTHAGGSHAGVEVATEAGCRIAPPFAQFGIWSSCGVGVAVGAGEPVYLRRYEVAGAVGEPCHRVGADVVVLPVGAEGHRVETLDIGATFLCHAGGAKAEADVGTVFLHHGIEFAHEQIDVSATPVVDILFSTAYAGILLLEVGIVLRGVIGRNLVGVKIVIKQETVDAVVGINFLHDSVEILAHLRKSRIEDLVFVVLGRCTVIDNPAFGKYFEVLRCRACLPVAAETERIHPCIAFETALVAFLHGESQRIPARVLAACARHPFAPGLVGRFVHGVGPCAHVQTHTGIVTLFVVIEILEKFSLAFFLIATG